MASSLLAVRREYLGCCMMSHAVNNSMLGCHEDVSEISMKFSTFFRTFKNPSVRDLEHLVLDPVVQPVNLHPPL